MSSVNPNIKTWQGKRTDFLLILLYSLIQGFIIHILVSWSQSMKVKYPQEFGEAFTNPGTFFITVILLLFMTSPVWIYFRKVPKKLQLDLENRRLEIKKRRKTLGYNLDYIRFYKRQDVFFFILEIHATFQTARNGSVEKLATVMIVPNWGLSWNKKVMTEIVNELKLAEVSEIKTRKAIPLSDYFRD